MDADRLAKWKALDEIRVAKNCPASWRHMHGDDRVRHCTHCDRNVYNLSNMTRDEAAEVIERTEGRLCARFYRRPDGMIMTADCPRGMNLRIGLSTIAAVVMSALGLAAVFPVYAGSAAMSPGSRIKMYERRIKDYDESIAQEKDRTVKKDLVELRNKEQEKLVEYLASLRDR